MRISVKKTETKPQPKAKSETREKVRKMNTQEFNAYLRANGLMH